MKNIKLFSSLLLLLLCIGVAKAQTSISKYNISGVVADSINNEPLRGVYVTTGKQGAQTDINGNFTIVDVPQGKVLVHTMYGFPYSMTTQELNLNGDTTLHFALKAAVLHGDAVVVTGTRTERRLADTPVLTTVITANQIKKSGAVSTMEAIQDNIPGIVITPNAMGNNMRIKGLNSRYILFLVDGERMVSEGAGGSINFDQVDFENIERIEMINGAASALYGSNAVGAVINIITKEPTHKFETGANFLAESNNTYREQISIGTNLKKFSSRATAFHKTSAGFSSDGDGPSAASYEDWGASLNLAYKVAPRADVNVVGRFFQHETFNSENSMSVVHSMDRNLAAGANGGYRSEDGRNNVRLSVNYDKFLNYDVLEKKSDELRKENASSYLSTRLVNTFNPTDRWELVGGVEYNHEENFATTTLGDEPTTKAIEDMNIFAQAEYELFKNFDAVVGARYTYNTQFNSAFTPKVSLMYKVAGFTFRGGVGSAFRAPSIKELYYDFNHNGMFWIYGNPDLKAEKGLYSSLSAEYTKGVFNASVSGYYNDISNKITQNSLINTEGKEERHYTNVSSATLKGFDVNVDYTFFRELVISGHYSFCDAVDNSTGLQLMDNVKHSGTVAATWNGKIRRSPFSLQFAGRMNSPKQYQSQETDSAGDVITTLEESDPYSIWKVVLVKPFRIKKHTLELTLKCDNIFDFKETSFINSGRQYLVGLRYRFK